jgi:CrcB protein
MTLLLVAIGAAIGAPLRYLVDRAILGRHDSVFPWGILTINIAGSMVLGFLFGGAQAHGVSTQITALLGTGFCGALTTYSTFGYETTKLLQNRMPFYAAANAIVSVLAGLGAAFAGFAVAQAIWG